MDLIQLQTFIAVADEGNITKAARAMLRAPSNVSTRIRQLEREIGVALLVRDKRQVTLSAEGERFLHRARQIVDLAQDAKNFARPGEPHGLFRLGSLESTAAVRIPEILAQYHLAHRAVDLELRAGPSGWLHQELLQGRLTAALTDGRPTSPHLTGRLAFIESMVVVAPLSADISSSEFRGIGPAAFVFGENCSYRQRFEAWMTDLDMEPARMVEIPSYHAMIACVAAGAGIAMVPESLLSTLPGAARVQVIPVDGELGSAHTWLTWRRDGHSSNLDALVTLMKLGDADGA
ncbi:LysR family transcriptional regulator [Aeromicrobium sp. CF3.5]|uniref:LysR family transcriptional regulator n=1 Tax=Aeromicrobium sp. CF3.5 TaxID=3373078 RepID=UPI003EE6E813